MEINKATISIALETPSNTNLELGENYVIDTKDIADYEEISLPMDEAAEVFEKLKQSLRANLKGEQNNGV